LRRIDIDVNVNVAPQYRTALFNERRHLILIATTLKKKTDHDSRAEHQGFEKER
jgi:hypothetical protein